MKKLLLIIFVLSYPLLSQTITWTDVSSSYILPDGVSLFKGTRSSPILEAYYLDVDLNNPDLAIRSYITNSPKGVNTFTSSVGAYAAVNGGYFGGATSYSAVVYPFEVKAQNISSLTRNSQSYPVVRSFFGMNFDRSLTVDWIYHFGNGVDDIRTYPQPMSYILNDPSPKPPPLQNEGTPYDSLLVGIGGGPTLVKNSQINVTYNEEIFWGSGVGLDNSDPRTGVGYTAANHVILLVADGRQSISQGVGLTEMAQIFVDLGCVEAMNLDGGGSTQMAVGSQMVNSPSTGSTYRTVPSILAIVHSDSLNLNTIPTYEKIIDTGDDEASLNGEGWFPTANPGFYGTTPAELNAVGTGESYAAFNLNLPDSGKYEVYAWWVSASNRAEDTPFIIEHGGSIDTVRIDQSVNGSSWQMIGTFNFSGDLSEKIIISDDASGTASTYVVADAIKIVSYDPTITSIKDGDDNFHANDFILFNNYPNPFNPITKIRFTIPRHSGRAYAVDALNASTTNVLLKIYDVLGNEISTLVNENKLPGTYEVEFNGKGLSSGIYFSKLSIDGNNILRKMVLMK
jgi:phosphodiester glycosidase/type IX secretion system substrate protein